nr:ribose-phosphate pyrophosphokinase [Clostridiales bacterium]
CFGLFAAGLNIFDNAYSKGIFDKVFTTNLVYRIPELAEREWYCEVDCSKYLSYIIDTLNLDKSISRLLDTSDKIDAILRKNGYKI